MSLLDLADLTALTPDALEAKARTNPEWFRQVVTQFTTAVEQDRQEAQLSYAQIVNPMARPVFESTARQVAIVGGNRSSKTDTAMLELSIALTGHVPIAFQPWYPLEKLKFPCRARVVCNTLNIVLPELHQKLRWDYWNGEGDPETGRGHWGWIPRHCLVGGTWERAYNAAHRTLHTSTDSSWVGSDGARWQVRAHNTCEFLAYNQDLSDFAGKSLHLVIHDELPPADVYRENRMRTLDTKGRVLTAFTPPDEGGQSVGDVAWFYEHIYQRGLPGPGKDPGIDTVILWTERNSVLPIETLDDLTRSYTDEQRRARLHGEFIHLGGVVYKLFTPHEQTWCFRCAKTVLPVGDTCPTCTSQDLVAFTHVVEPFEVPKTWPVVMVIDPHPRKADAVGWFALSPSDTIYMIHEMEQAGTADEVVREIKAWENEAHVHPVLRLMDPNIATETNDKLQRGWTLRRAYDEAGLRCDMAVDEVNAGIDAVTHLLRPDAYTRRPAFQVFNACRRFIHGMQHWAWGDWARDDGTRDVKERVRERHKDFPDLVRYLAMSRASFRGLRGGGPPSAGVPRRRGYARA